MGAGSIHINNSRFSLNSVGLVEFEDISKPAEDDAERVVPWGLLSLWIFCFLDAPPTDLLSDERDLTFFLTICSEIPSSVT
jgi:hypothetical protein